MNFGPCDNSEVDVHVQQVQEKWGKTEAYKEFSQRQADKTPQQIREDGASLMEIFAQIGQLRHQDPGSARVQELVGKLQAFIIAHYYTCTPQILRGLGQLYIAGGSMTENIDNAGGEGTAAFTNKAIEIYVM